MALTAWFIGSVPQLASQGFDIDGVGKVISQDDYYLRDFTAALSLIDEFETQGQTTVASLSVFITKAGFVRMTASGNFTIDWTSAELQRLLGFTQGNLSGDDNYTADSYSPLFWSPGWPETPDDSVPVGDVGSPVSDTVVTMAADGTTVFTTNVSREHNEMSFASVPKDRTHTSARLPGEYIDFWLEVLLKGFQFKVSIQIDEDRTSIAAASFGLGLGPYKLRARSKPIKPGHRRERKDNDNLWSISVPEIVVDEYS